MILPFRVTPEAMRDIEAGTLDRGTRRGGDPKFARVAREVRGALDRGERVVASIYVCRGGPAIERAVVAVTSHWTVRDAMAGASALPDPVGGPTYCYRFEAGV